jgi:hypothetical protein
MTSKRPPFSDASSSSSSSSKKPRGASANVSQAGLPSIPQDDPPLVGAPSEQISEDQLKTKKVTELIQMCKSLGLPYSKRTKADLIVQILSPQESTRDKLKELIHLDLIKQHRDRLFEYARKVYPERPQSAPSSSDASSPGHNVFDLLRSLDNKISLTTSQRLVLALYGPMGRGK